MAFPDGRSARASAGRAAAMLQTGERVTGRWWFVTALTGFHPRARVESPLSFRTRGIFITSDARVPV